MTLRPAYVPPAIRTDHSNAFAHDTVHRRLPDIFDQVLAIHADYAPGIQRALRTQRDAMPADAPLPVLTLPAPDWANWADLLAARAGETWLGTDWWFAENYAYRLLIEAVRWWETGLDPFKPIKAAELADDGLTALLGAALAASGSPEERLHDRLHGAWWANRIDLSYAASTGHGTRVQDDDRLADDCAAVVAHLLAARGDVHLVTDNFGRELAMDLVLADELLSEHEAEPVARRVFLHVKMHPTFVSDATAADVRDFITRLAEGELGSDARDLGIRLQAAFDAERLRLAPDWFWNSARPLWELPPRLHDLLQTARLVILKGDANYRRMGGDAVWDPTTPFAEATRYFPAPLLALRVCKSPVVVGLPPGLAEQLTAEDPDWQINGKHGMAQFKP